MGIVMSCILSAGAAPAAEDTVPVPAAKLVDEAKDSKQPPSVPAPPAKPTAKAELVKQSPPAPIAKVTIPAAPDKPVVKTEAVEQASPVPMIKITDLSESEQIKVGSNQEVKADERVRELVTVFGDSTLAGEVEHDMVTVFGNAKMTGKVGHDMVTVFGDAEVNGPVDHDLVVVFGNLKLGSNAVMNHDCVVVFGKIDQNPKSILGRQAFQFMPWFSSVGNYIRSGPLLGRLIPPTSGLAWIVVALHFVLYFLIALILPKPAAAGVKRLDENPFLSFGVGVLIMILLAPVTLILIATGIGIILVPFLMLADLAFAVLGKVSTLEFFGLQILRRIRSDADACPITAFLIGFLLVTVIYMIPVLGLLVWMILRPLALGTAVLAVFGSMRKNGNGTTDPGVPVHSAPGQNTAHVVPPPVNPGIDAGGSSQKAGLESTAVGVSGVTVMQRAGFWIRTAATALDFIILIWILVFTHGFFLLFWVAYHIAMWTWRGTTIGGLICRLKVVRTDGRPLDFGVALVRGLSAVLSAAALCLGFFWVGWTSTRQSWHDMIADTVIVRAPRAFALI